MQLIVSGGIRSGADVAKALALGADAVSIGVAALLALGCNRADLPVDDGGDASTSPTTTPRSAPRPGSAPTATPAAARSASPPRTPTLERRLDAGPGRQAVANYLRAITMEVTALARACGKSDVHHLEPEDLAALTVEAAAMARVPLAGTDWIPGWPTERVSLPPAEVVVIGGGVTGLSTARALVELGVTDVLVLDRDTMGSGGTGKSSGVVRCHYGIRSLAAMAWRVAARCSSRRAEILGRGLGLPPTGYLVGVGQENLGALRANVAMQRQLGIEVELVGHDDARALWPAARLDDFADFAYEPHGGYGDGHQTALAFAVAARRGGARLRQHTPVAALEVRGDRVVGVDWRTASRIGAAQVVVAAGPWSRRPGRRRRHRPPRPGPAGPDPPRRPGRAELGPVPVFSDLVSLQYVRTEGIGVAAGRRQRPLRPRVVRPRRLPRAGRRRRVGQSPSPSSTTASPALDGATLRPPTPAATT